MTASAGGGHPTGVEIEVKLTVNDPARMMLILEHPAPSRLAGFAAAGEIEQHVVVDGYVDTADGRLAAAGARARVRTDDAGSALLALKRHGVEEAGVTARHEVEGPAGAGLDPSAWPDSVARGELLELTAGAPLIEIASLRQRRHVRMIQRGSTEVELSLDELEALDPTGGDRVVATRWELEAELKAGDRTALEELAIALGRLPGLAPASGSKLSFALSARQPRR